MRNQRNNPKYLDVLKTRIFYDEANEVFSITGKIKNNGQPFKSDFPLTSDKGRILKEIFVDNNLMEQDPVDPPLPHKAFLEIQQFPSFDTEVSQCRIDDNNELYMALSKTAIVDCLPLGVDNKHQPYTAELFSDVNSNLFFYGQPGTGKSVFMLSAVRYFDQTSSPDKPKMMYFDFSGFEASNYYMPSSLQSQSLPKNSYDFLINLRSIKHHAHSSEKWIIMVEHIDNLLQDGTSFSPQFNANELRVEKAVRAEILETIVSISQQNKNISFVFTSSMASSAYNGILNTCSQILYLGRLFFNNDEEAGRVLFKGLPTPQIHADNADEKMSLACLWDKKETKKVELIRLFEIDPAMFRN